jgi:3-hydroxyisobutyrate dehydrogenase-like beta-hydroxyacid dehydrogenase
MRYRAAVLAPFAGITADGGRTWARVLRPGSIVLETSTVAPADIDAMASDLEAAGVRLLDAAIISGVPAMAAGTSSMLIGAAEDTVDEAVAGVLDRLSAKLTWTGAPGSAMAMKVIHNAVAHATMVTLAEARAMGQAYGITESALVDILRGEEAGLLRPLLHRLGERVPQRDYEGGMSLAAARKDSVLALEMAAEQRIPLYSLAASHTAYENALREFDGRDDYAVIAELWRTD